MRLTVYGAGYVGLVTSICLAEVGHEVMCLEIDPEKVEKLNQGQLPIYEEGLETLLHRNLEQSSRLFTTDRQRSDFFF